MEEEIILLDDKPKTIIDSLANFDLSFLQTLLYDMGDNPVSVFIWVFLHGGWIVFLILGWFAFRELWLDAMQTKAQKKKNFVLLAIDIPRMSEQTVKAVENMFAHLAGAHSPSSFVEKWFEGKFQDPISMEIISHEGHIQYLIRAVAGLRDLIEASIYAQYPDAEIFEVGDYAEEIPAMWPNSEYELFGTELVPVKNDVYPLKTYEDFEHKLTGEYKDPLAAMLEAFSRLGPSERAYFQILIVPIDQKDFAVKAAKEIKALKGEKEPPKRTMADKILDMPMNFLNALAGGLLGGSFAESAKKDDGKEFKMLMMSPGERRKLEFVEKKMSHIQYQCKIRFMYWAKKEHFSKGKILQSFIGSIKQFNTNDLQALKPEGKKVGMNGTLLLFKARRNDGRKRRIVSGYRNRSTSVGNKTFHLGTDELASLWHLPMSKDVKAPQLKKTEAKKVEPPINLPFAS